MRFGPVPVADAEGAILAHATTVGTQRLRKAHRLSAADIAALQAAGVASIVASVLEAGDLDEDEAAEAIASALGAEHVERKQASTGRVNLHAEAAGVFTVDKALVDALNRIDPSITLATLGQFATVEKGQMVATVKIIPFAVPGALVAQATACVAPGPVFSVHPFAQKTVALIQTVLPGVKSSVLDKTVRVTEGRLGRSASRIGAEDRVPHETDAVATAIARLLPGSDMVLVFGASAMCDFDDVIPAAIRAAGGQVERAGMPVDPGNLIVLGHVGGKPVLGAPGCARSPKVNGFDWVLDRLVAGLPVTGDDIAAMGVGGLLMEIPTRPQPREGARPSRRRKVHAILLAAGRSSRMGTRNKLLADFGGVPLVRRTALQVLGSKVSGVVGVVGHMAGRMRSALSGIDIELVENPHFAEGLSTSIKAGFSALPDDADGAMIVLADMPGVTSADMNRLVDTFQQSGGRAIVRASHDGRRGNPVILPRALFGEIARLAGDTGARHVVEAGLAEVIEVEIGQAAALDVDTPDAMLLAGGVLVD